MNIIFTNPNGKSLTGSSKWHNNRKEENMDTNTRVYGRGVFTLVCNGFPLFYWKNENTAELDFVLQIAGEIVPVEVKKGKRTRSPSLNMFMKHYNCNYAIRISAKNFGFENKIKSAPLYAVWCMQQK